jgi:hypothetical protein
LPETILFLDFTRVAQKRNKNICWKKAPGW